ncbi:methyltransferase domain-containing protein [Streptomyces diastatochromogenes]|nr:methyltransferase domain-containing protein [Streptomyces diastatochromogenes]
MGFDPDDASIAHARSAAAKAGVDGRVAFEVAEAATYPGDGYDLVTFTDSLHDMGDPRGAVAHARATLADDGAVLVVEPLAADRFEDDFANPYARIGYAVSTLVCTPPRSPSRERPPSARWRAKPGCARSSPRAASPASGASPRTAPRSTSSWRHGHDDLLTTTDVERVTALDATAQAELVRGGRLSAESWSPPRSPASRPSTPASTP